MKMKEEKVMNCCKAIAGKMPKDCNKNNKNKSDCCGNDMCNPFMGQCPICIAIGIVSEQIVLSSTMHDPFLKEKFQQRNEHLISHYIADILRPPDMV